MSKKTVKKKVDSAMPQSLTEVAEYVGKIGILQRQINLIESKLNESIEKLKKEAMEKVSPLDKDILDLAEGVYAFSQVNKANLIGKEGKKTIDIVTGTLRWYLTPPAVKVDDEENAILELETNGLEEFVRTRKTIDKEAILKDPDGVSNLSYIQITQEEIFSIKPAEVNFELLRGKRKFKKEVQKNG